MARERESAIIMVQQAAAQQVEQRTADQREEVKSLKDLIFFQLGQFGLNAPPGSLYSDAKLLSTEAPVLPELTNLMGCQLISLCKEGRYLEMRKLLEIYPSWIDFFTLEETELEFEGKKFYERKALLDIMGQKLLQHAINSEQDKAKALLDIHSDLLPFLLSFRGSVADLSELGLRGIKHTGTAYQLAMMRGPDPYMMDMLISYFEKFEGGQDKKAAQEREIDNPPEMRTFNFGFIVAAINVATLAQMQAALRKEQNDSLLCGVFNQFRDDFFAHSANERFFNPQHLLQALKVLEEQWDNWNENQRDFFCRQVIGYVQRYVPAIFARALAQGLYYVIEKKEILQALFNFRCGGGVFFPLSDSMGFDVYVTPASGRSGATMAYRTFRTEWDRIEGRPAIRIFVLLENFVTQLQKNYSALILPAIHPQTLLLNQ